MTCEHYTRHCHVRAECCSQWVACRLCHDAQFQDHAIDRHAIRLMRCDACQTEQPCAQTCSQCAAQMGAYFCATCNLFDDAGEEKRVFHCDGCGICRVGGRESFFHCTTCCGCYPLSLRDKHKCLEGSMHRECAICLEVTFASLERVHVLPCGHVLHGACWQEYINHGHYRCPTCRTRMFWVDDGDDDGDDDDEGEEGEEGEEDASNDETGDSGGSESDDSEEEEEEDGESESEDGDDTTSGTEVASSAQAATPVSSPSATTESGVAQRLVTAIFNAISSAADSDESDEGGGGGGGESAVRRHSS